MRECTHKATYLGIPFCNFSNKSIAFHHIAEKMASRFVRWKLKHLSLAGKNTLIRSAALSITTFTMQIFLHPNNLCDWLNMLYHLFLWGTNEGKYYLSLNAWGSLCTLKAVGGLGIQRSKDMNCAFVTKLAWKVVTEPKRTWVKLIWSKYLRGRQVVDFQRTMKAILWVWNGIKACKESLDKGLYYMVRRYSTIDIREDPWLPKFSNFKLPGDLIVPEELQVVGDLMDIGKTSWNK